MRRVVVSGIGVVSPLGSSPAAILDNAGGGVSGVHRFEGQGVGRLRNPLAATSSLDAAAVLDAPRRRMLDRFSIMALYAANQAVASACDVLNDLDRASAGVFLGTGMGGTLSMDASYRTLYEAGVDRIKPFTVLMGMHNAAAAWIGIEHDLRGPNLTYSTACSSSTVAIGEAWMRVASGQLDVALAGGSEAPLSCGSLKAWESLQTLASIDVDEPSASCRPFSRNRTGMVLGEGAAVLTLEARERALARGADIHGEILGYGLTNDASHITKPGTDGPADAMRMAMKSASLAVGDIDAINAHGTGTQANDATETTAIRQVFAERADHVPVSATKAMHGHLLGAAGALECVLSLLSMQAGLLLPTVHLSVPDPACDLDYVPNRARSAVDVRTMLSNSFAFGGTNAVLALGAA